MNHWTHTYTTHPQVIYEVDAILYQNETLTYDEMATVETLLYQANAINLHFVLDVACGMGRHSITFAKQGYTVVGVDQSPGFLAIARENSRGMLGITFQEGNVKNLAFPSQEFPMVTLLGNSFGLCDHRTNLQILCEIYRVLKPGGVFVFDVTDKDVFLESLPLEAAFIPSYSSRMVETQTFGTVHDERWRQWEGYSSTLYCKKRHSSKGKVLLDTPYELRFYGQDELSELLQSVGFKNILIEQFRSSQSIGAMTSRIFLLCKK